MVMLQVEVLTAKHLLRERGLRSKYFTYIAFATQVKHTTLAEYSLHKIK